MARLTIVSFLTMATLNSGCAVKPPLAKSPLPAAAREALQNGTAFQLVSLEPEPLQKKADDETWHDEEWVVLGKTEISDPKTRQKVIAAVEAAIREHDGEVAACFEPRHVIAVQHNDKGFEFEIYFKCRQLYWYVDRKRQDVIYIGESEKAALDAVLKEAGVTLARPRQAF